MNDNKKYDVKKGEILFLRNLMDKLSSVFIPNLL